MNLIYDKLRVLDRSFFLNKKASQRVFGGLSIGLGLFLACTRNEFVSSSELISYVWNEPNPKVRFILNQHIQRNYITDSKELMLHFSRYLSYYPNDPFCAYYLFYQGLYHENQSNFTLASYYYSQVLDEHRDLTLPSENNSIHYSTFKRLLQLKGELSPFKRLSYQKEFVERFSDSINVSQNYYALALTYESLGLWALSLRAYEQFLQQKDSFVDAQEDRIRKMLSFSQGDPYWVETNLTTLVDKIQNAVLNADLNTLNRLRNPKDFFITSWATSLSALVLNSHSSSSFQSFLATYLQRRRRYGRSLISFSSQIDSFSNGTQALLASEGWETDSLSKWYFVFNRVSFPSNISIHQGWEWIGIYLGERL